MVVLASAPLVFAVLYLAFHFAPGDAWYRAMTFLVVASPCAVVISTPAAVLSAMAAGARAGTLFKSGAALEALAGTRIVALDKTGTLTRGEMRLVEVRPFAIPEEEALALAAGLERHSEHPVARAVTVAWPDPAPDVADVQAVRGKGIRGHLDGAVVWAGTRRMAAEQDALITAEAEAALSGWEENGMTTLLLGRDRQVLAALAVADTERHEAAEAVRLLRARGLRVVMLSGDRAAVARHIAARLGIDEVRAPLLPEEKLATIQALHREGCVLMVGDGVNDAPAMAGADVGMAMGTGSGVSLESADVVLMKDDLRRIAGAWDLARSTAATIRFNLSFALGIIGVVGVLALAGKVPLPLGVVAHEGGTLFVVAVGLRLLLHRVGRDESGGGSGAGAAPVHSAEGNVPAAA
jgi:Cd2+/Zn2+-exporting ATPase